MNIHLDLPVGKWRDLTVSEMKELDKLLPEVLPYLALEHGYRFMIDREEYEDVWKEGDEV